MKSLRTIIFLILLVVTPITNTQEPTAVRTQEILTVDPVAVDPIVADQIPSLNTEPQRLDIKEQNREQIVQEQINQLKTGYDDDQKKDIKIENTENTDSNGNTNDNRNTKDNGNTNDNGNIKDNGNQNSNLNTNQDIKEQQKAQLNNVELNPDPRRANRQKNPTYDEEAARKMKDEKQRVNKQRQEKARTEADRKAQESAERTNKYKEQQKRLNDLRRKRQEYEAKRKAQMGEGEKVEYDDRDLENQISQTQKTRIEEKKKMREILREQLNEKDQKYSYETIFFEIDNRVEQFFLRPSSNMTVNLRITVYVSKDNVYSFVENVDQEQPVRLYAYVENKSIIGQISCYFEGALKFQAKGGSVYSIKIFNSGGPKLISLSYPKFITAQMASNFITSQKGQSHFNGVQKIMQGIRDSMIHMQRTRFIDLNNANILSKSMRQYFSYQIVQIIVVGIMCYIQVYVIKNMLKNTSIL